MPDGNMVFELCREEYQRSIMPSPLTGSYINSDSWYHSSNEALQFIVHYRANVSFQFSKFFCYSALDWTRWTSTDLASISWQTFSRFAHEANDDDKYLYDMIR